MTNFQEKLTKIGTEWNKNGQHRIYFDAKKFSEVEINRYNANFYSNKNFAIWYDYNTQEFGYRADGVKDDAKKAIENIKSAIA